MNDAEIMCGMRIAYAWGIHGVCMDCVVHAWDMPGIRKDHAQIMPDYAWNMFSFVLIYIYIYICRQRIKLVGILFDPLITYACAQGPTSNPAWIDG